MIHPSAKAEAMPELPEVPEVPELPEAPEAEELAEDGWRGPSDGETLW